MERFLRFLAGYVRIHVTGGQTERFLNLCRSRGIAIRNLSCDGEGCLRGSVSIGDFFLLRPVRSKTGVHIRVTEKHGMPFFFYRSKKRKAFFLGVLLSFSLMTALSTRVWNIHIEGNVVNSTPVILAFLKEQGIVHGIARSRVDCSRIASAVRKNYPEITWVSARLQGTRLILTVQEGESVLQPAETGEKTACSLAAGADGEIVRIITREGVPLVQPGDVCKKGDVLVLGRLDITDDSQEVVRREYVHADADIYVRHEVAYYREFPMAYERETPTGNIRRGFYVKAGPWYVECGGKAKSGWRRTAEEFPLRITENFTLPVYAGRILLEEYEKEKAVYAEKEAKALASMYLQRFEENLLQKGFQISGNNVRIKTDQTACVSSGSLTVIEKTGEEVPVEEQDPPKERNTEDGEQYH